MLLEMGIMIGSISCFRRFGNQPYSPCQLQYFIVFSSVTVEGFGPFGNHLVNASWVAVQELEKMGVANDIDLVVKEIPVEYETVRSTVPQLRNQHKPHVSYIIYY